MLVHGDLQRAQNFVAKEHAVVVLHIEKLDGEHVGGVFQFFLGHHQRRGMFLAMPPFHHRRDGGESGKRTLAQDAEQVQVGEFSLEFSGRGRAVENDALQVLARRLASCG